MFAAGIGQASSRPTLHTNTVTTTTITWHRPANYPDADVRVLIGLNIDGIRDSCEGYFGCNPDGRESYYTVDDQPIEHHHVTGWAEMPEGPAP